MQYLPKNQFRFVQGRTRSTYRPALPEPPVKTIRFPEDAIVASRRSTCIYCVADKVVDLTFP